MAALAAASEPQYQPKLTKMQPKTCKTKKHIHFQLKKTTIRKIENVTSIQAFVVLDSLTSEHFKTQYNFIHIYSTSHSLPNILSTWVKFTKHFTIYFLVYYKVENE